MKTKISILRSILLLAAVLTFHWSVYAKDPIGGIGVLVEDVKSQPLTIIKVFPDSPAEKAGLVPGQILQKVDGVAVNDTNRQECVRMVQGMVGTPVTLEIVDMAQKKTNTVTMTRAELK